MDAVRVLATVRTYAVAGRIVLTQHAKLRMVQRNVKYADIRCALSNARTCVSGGSAGTWKVCGPDTDADDLDVVVAIEAGIIVVTVY